MSKKGSIVKEVNWPKETSPTIRRLATQAKDYYGIDLSYESYLEWCRMVACSGKGDNYFKVHSLFSKTLRGHFFALYVDGQWVAVQRPHGAKHINNLLEPSVLDEFRWTRLHYYNPVARKVVRKVKETALKRINWEHVSMSNWVEACERIRQHPSSYGVCKLGEQDGQEVWAFNRKGLYWIACLWDSKSKYITEILDREHLYQAGILNRQDDQD